MILSTASTKLRAESTTPRSVKPTPTLMLSLLTWKVQWAAVTTCWGDSQLIPLSKSLQSSIKMVGQFRLQVRSLFDIKKLRVQKKVVGRVVENWLKFRKGEELKSLDFYRGKLNETLPSHQPESLHSPGTSVRDQTGEQPGGEERNYGNLLPGSPARDTRQPQSRCLQQS